MQRRPSPKVRHRARASGRTDIETTAEGFSWDMYTSQILRSKATLDIDVKIYSWAPQPSVPHHRESRRMVEKRWPENSLGCPARSCDRQRKLLTRETVTALTSVTHPRQRGSPKGDIAYPGRVIKGPSRSTPFKGLRNLPKLLCTRPRQSGRKPNGNQSQAALKAKNKHNNIFTPRIRAGTGPTPPIFEETWPSGPFPGISRGRGDHEQQKTSPYVQPGPENQRKQQNRGAPGPS
jgi:hypothetical protein